MTRFGALLLLLANCAADLPAAPDCRRSDECDAALCISGRCETAAGQDAAGGPPSDGDPAADVPDAPRAARPGPCAHAIAPTSETLVLNELLANVPAGADGDANGDGVRDPYDDEFLELVNVSPTPLDLAGVRISSGGKLKHLFDSVCILSGDSVVVFGGGSVGPSVPGNALIADTRFAFANDGGEVVITTPNGMTTRLEYDRAPAASLTRVPQLNGPQWVNHLELSPHPFSPGTCPDRTLLAGGCPSPSTSAVDAGTD